MSADSEAFYVCMRRRVGSKAAGGCTARLFEVLLHVRCITL